MPLYLRNYSASDLPTGCLIPKTVIQDNRLLPWAGVQPNGSLSLHTLRKSCVQNWANHLPPNVTKELAGHTSISTTMEYYAQVDDDHRAKAAAVIEALVSGPAEDEVEMTDARMTPEAELGQFSGRS